jgi:hypothetical protein
VDQILVPLAISVPKSGSIVKVNAENDFEIGKFADAPIEAIGMYNSAR